VKQTPDGMKPLVKSVSVDLPIDRAFQLFTRGMGGWWPLDTHSIAEDTRGGRVKAKDVVFEERAGGRIYETMSDGSEGTWGRVLTWEPPRRVVFSWKPNLTDGPHTEVEVRFTSAASGTEVELEHRGWERLGDAAALRRAEYDTGWGGVLELFQTAARPPATAGK
jgi:uncharacterized protein YndB with AHSA1/START domain